MSAGESRLAPTQRIETGGQPVQPVPVGPRASLQQPTSGPAGAPSAAPPASFPLAPSVAPRPAAPRPPTDLAPSVPPVPVASDLPPLARPLTDPSLSMPAPRRGRGLLIVLLIVDLGLAAAGTWMLVEGLAA
ncbi:MAG: hypothetical protein M3680_10065, partial [Myxococcota bacterium]|nr:hypothetical protein [Myxococcota bacterium]